MARSLTFYRDLSKFFPKDLPLARLMARLIVLWQDLVYEEAGILEDTGFETLDGKTGAPARRIYFLRGNSRTLNSAKKLLDQLVADRTFSAWLAEDNHLGDAFYAAKGTFDRHRRTFDRVRNTIGAHVEQDVGDAIANFISGDVAAFEIHSEDFVRPHLASHILAAALTKGAPPHERADAFSASVKPMAAATGAMITAMSAAVTVYMERLGLLPQ